MPKTTTLREEQNQERPRRERSPRTSGSWIRWEHLHPIEFPGEDTSLTQAELAVLK